MHEENTTEQKTQQLTPEHMRALVSVTIHEDGDLAAKGIAALINAVASISDAGARKELAIAIIEESYKFTDEYNNAVMSFAQRNAFGRGTDNFSRNQKAEGTNLPPA